MMFHPKVGGQSPLPTLMLLLSWKLGCSYEQRATAIRNAPAMEGIFPFFLGCCTADIACSDIAKNPCVRTGAMLLFLVTLKNFDVCTVTMGVNCMPSSPKEYLRP